MIYKEALIEALKTRGMTQKSLSIKIGWTAAQVNDSIKKRKTISVDNLIPLLEGMGYELVVRDTITGKDLGMLDAQDEIYTRKN